MQFLSLDNISWLKRLRARDISGIVVMGHVHGDVGQFGKREAKELTIPWTELHAGQSEIAWLRWTSRLTDVVGRQADIDELVGWAKDGGNGVRTKFVVGDGGVGKTRLAAEVAERLKSEQRAAGFSSLEEPNAFFTKSPGTLILIDYPEESRKSVRFMLDKLRHVEANTPIRILFLSRRASDYWETDFRLSHAETFIDGPDFVPVRLSEDAAYELYQAAQGNVPNEKKVEPREVTKDVLIDWLNRDREINWRPLFIAAAAIHSMIHPETLVVTMSGAEVIGALVDRELARLENQSKQHDLHDQALGRLSGFAAIRDTDGVAGTFLKGLAEADFDLGLPTANRVVDDLSPTPSWVRDRIPAPKPDIVAACLLVKAFRSNTERAPDWLWAAIEDDVPRRLETLGRLIHDAEVVLGLGAQNLGDIAWGAGNDTLSAWIRDAFSGYLDRCQLAREFVADQYLPLGLVPLEVAVWRTLCDAVQDEAGKAGLLSNLSNGLSKIAADEEALDASRKAVEIYRRVAASNTARYEPDLATSLHTLSNCLSDVGDAEGALDAIRKAVEIIRRLAASNPARYEPDLAMSLGALGSHLRKAGKLHKAAAAFREGADLVRPHAVQFPEGPAAKLLANLERVLTKTEERGAS